MTRPVGIGMIGTGLMCRVHSHALLVLRHIAPDTPCFALTRLCGRDPARLTAAARRYGFTHVSRDWREVIADPRVDVIATVASNDIHAEVVLEAIAAGKHVFCEKPLGRTLGESTAMRDAAQGSDRLHVCGFNYRFMPALHLAYKLVSEGQLGQIVHFRGRYLQDWGWAPTQDWHFDPERCGPGVIGDYSHLIDTAHRLAGSFAHVSAVTTTAPRAGASTVQDAYAAVGALQDGALVNLEATRLATGRKAEHVVEVNGTQGSLRWSMQELNYLDVDLAGVDGLQGSRRISVLGAGAPFGELWWADGHGLGWDHCFVHLWQAILRAVAAGPPHHDAHLATFTDGWQTDLVIDAIARSAASGARASIVPSANG